RQHRSQVTHRVRTLARNVARLGRGAAARVRARAIRPGMARRFTRARPWYTLDMFGSVLIPIDLTPSSERVVGRVATRPRATGARPTLVHAAPKRMPQEMRQLAESDAHKALSAAAKTLKRALPRSVARSATIDTVVTAGAAAAEIARHAR